MTTGLAISATGSLIQASSQTARTISITPSAIGNLFTIVIQVESTTTTFAPTAVSGGNCVGLSGSGNWTQIANTTFSTSVPAVWLCAMYVGVATTTGAANVTVTTTATTGTSGVWVDLDCQQYTCTNVGAATAWAFDGSPASLINSTAATAAIYPTLTPVNTNSMYLASCFPAGRVKATGQTAGYTVVLDAAFNAVVYNPSVSGAQSPTTVNTNSSGTTTAIKSTTMAALLTATNRVGSFMPFFM
jgi:hypothetical protein